MSYQTAKAKLDAIYIGEDFVPAASTTIADEVGSNDGTLSGSTTSAQAVASPPPAAWLPYVLNTSDAYFFTLTSNISFGSSSPFTIMLWARRISTSGHGIIFGRNDNTRFFRMTNGADIVRLGIGASNYDKTLSVSTTDWNHYAIVRNADNTIDLYVNGAIEQETWATDSSAIEFEIILAKDNIGTDILNGLAGQIAYADEALTAQDLLDLYNGPTTTPTKYLVTRMG